MWLCRKAETSQGELSSLAAKEVLNWRLSCKIFPAANNTPVICVSRLGFNWSPWLDFVSFKCAEALSRSFYFHVLREGWAHWRVAFWGRIQIERLWIHSASQSARIILRTGWRYRHNKQRTKAENTWEFMNRKAKQMNPSNCDLKYYIALIFILVKSI